MCFLIMQKHLYRQVVSFGVTSVDPLGSLSSEQGVGLGETGSSCLCQASGAVVRSLDFEQWEVTRVFKAVAGRDLIFILKVTSVIRGLWNRRNGRMRGTA